MVELKDTTLYRPAPSSVSEDVEFSNKRAAHCEGRQSAVTEDLFYRDGAFPDPVGPATKNLRRYIEAKEPTYNWGGRDAFAGFSSTFSISAILAVWR